MKNICFFNTTSFWGGGEKFYVEYAIEFKKKGYNVFIVCAEGSPISVKAEENDIPQFQMKVKMLSFLNPLKFTKLIGYFKKNNIDTVLFSSSQDVKIGSMSAKVAGVECIVFRRGLAVPIKAKTLNIHIFKNVLTHIFANSEETKKTILAHLSPYIPAQKIKVIYNGIKRKEAVPYKGDPMEFIAKNKRGIVIGNAGRLTVQKSQHYFLELAERLKAQEIEFSIFIAGTGELEQQLDLEIRKKGLEKEVFLLGFVHDIPKFMSSIDIFILTSKWEGFGYVLVEAMVQSKPVLGFNITSNPEVVTHEETGYLVPYGDMDLLTKNTVSLIQNAELRKSLGSAGFKRVQEKFILEDRILELEEFLKTKP